MDWRLCSWGDAVEAVESMPVGKKEAYMLNMFDRLYKRRQKDGRDNEEDYCTEILGVILDALSQDYPVIGRADQLGLVIGLELVDPETQKPAPILAKSVVESALHCSKAIDGINYGLVMSVGGIFENILTLSPNLLISDAEIILFDRLIRHYLDLAIRKT